jgi:predicted DNA-binding protein (UPF0251 family)
MNMAKLRGKIVENNTTQEAVADTMNIDRSTFYRKIKSGGEGFTIKEVRDMINIIPLTREEVWEIFLD